MLILRRVCRSVSARAAVHALLVAHVSVVARPRVDSLSIVYLRLNAWDMRARKSRSTLETIRYIISLCACLGLRSAEREGAILFRGADRSVSARRPSLGHRPRVILLTRSYQRSRQYVGRPEADFRFQISDFRFQT